MDGKCARHGQSVQTCRLIRAFACRMQQKQEFLGQAHQKGICPINANSNTLLKVHNTYQVILYILNETAKPPLNIFSNILTYMIHKWLQFTLNMEKSIKLNLSKFHFHKLKLTCSIDRLYKGTIAFHFHQNNEI